MVYCFLSWVVFDCGLLIDWICWVLFIDLTGFDCFVLVGFSSWCLADLRDCFAFGFETLHVRRFVLFCNSWIALICVNVGLDL